MKWICRSLHVVDFLGLLTNWGAITKANILSTTLQHETCETKKKTDKARKHGLEVMVDVMHMRNYFCVILKDGGRK